MVSLCVPSPESFTRGVECSKRMVGVGVPNYERVGRMGFSKGDRGYLRKSWRVESSVDWDRWVGVGGVSRTHSQLESDNYRRMLQGPDLDTSYWV